MELDFREFNIEAMKFALFNYQEMCIFKVGELTQIMIINLN